MNSVERIQALHGHAGLIGVGHHTYWHQFDGLLDEMNRKLGVLQKILEEESLKVTSFGLVDNAASAYGIVQQIQGSGIDVLFIDMVTYATSSTFGVLCRSLDVPIVLVALQPMKAMDYPNGSTFMQLCNDDFCSISEFTGVAVRMGRKAPACILGYEVGDAVARAEISRWAGLTHALHDLKKGRLGLMGHTLEAMLDMHCDPTAVTAVFGCHVPLIEPHDLMRHYETVNTSDMERWKERILDFFDCPEPRSDPLTEKLTNKDLHTAARAAVALEALIAEKNLTGLAYYYEGTEGSPMRELMTNLIVGNSLLTGAGFPMCGEYDIKTLIGMLIMDRMGIGGSFAEFHPVDFEQNTVLVGHDGPHHINIADGRPVIRSLKKYHGKPGCGASVEFRLKAGPITMLSIGQTGAGAFKFIVAEGYSEDRPIPPTGNTNTHGRFGQDVRQFLLDWVAEGPTHHFALGVGHHARSLELLAHCLQIPCAVVRREKR